MIFDQASFLLLEYNERDVDAAEPIKSSSELLLQSTPNLRRCSYCQNSQPMDCCANEPYRPNHPTILQLPYNHQIILTI